jgi:hypothetical protein
MQSPRPKTKKLHHRNHLDVGDTIDAIHHPSILVVLVQKDLLEVLDHILLVPDEVLHHDRHLVQKVVLLDLVVSPSEKSVVMDVGKVSV